jgi:hypothetical protein
MESRLVKVSSGPRCVSARNTKSCLDTRFIKLGSFVLSQCFSTYLSVRSGKLRVFSTFENVPKAKNIIRLRYLSGVFLRKTECFITVGPGSFGKMLVPIVEYVNGHFFSN